MRKCWRLFRFLVRLLPSSPKNGDPLAAVPAFPSFLLPINHHHLLLPRIVLIHLREDHQLLCRFPLLQFPTRFVSDYFECLQVVPRQSQTVFLLLLLPPQAWHFSNQWVLSYIFFPSVLLIGFIWISRGDSCFSCWLVCAKLKFLIPCQMGFCSSTQNVGWIVDCLNHPWEYTRGFRFLNYCFC